MEGVHVTVNFEEALKTLERIHEQSKEPAIKEQLSRLTPQLKAFVQEKETERNKLLAANAEHQATITNLQGALVAREKDLADQARTIDDLKKKLEGAGKVSTATPLSLATSFKKVMETIQAEARKTEGIATTIKSMDLEVKGLVQVQEGVTSLLLPSVGTPVDAGALSTLRVSFGAIPVVAPMKSPSTSGPAPSTASPRQPSSDQ